MTDLRIREDRRQMNEMVIAGAALAAVAVVAWVMRGAIARAGLNAMQEKLAGFETLKAEHASMANELRYEAERRAAAEVTAARVAGLERTVAERANELSERDTRLAELNTRLTEERKAAAEKLALLNNAQEQLADAFKALSSDALRSNNQTFIELATITLEKFQEGAKGDLAARQQAVDELVKPLRESLGKVDDKLGRNREGPHRRLHRADHPGEGPRREPPAGAAPRDGESVARAAPAARARALGRDPVEARGRDRRHAGALRLL